LGPERSVSNLHSDALSILSSLFTCQSVQIGIRLALSFVVKSMPQACNQEDLCYARLYATYRSEWQAFAQTMMLESELAVTAN